MKALEAKMTSDLIGSFYPIIIFIGVVVIVVVVLWQGMSVAKTEIGGKQTTQYEKLSEQAITAEQKSADAQQRTAEALEDMRARLTAIEKLLRDVQ
jgi:sensor domain CHASE-containing protein